ncbi:hypothetical protein EGI11_06530 [Chryseobacterium sp. H3056]|uniref:Uncharacterized protein n=1 Tax=Kaistella daneshvariae TaxID=2487074 RepID=A0A3N0WVS3_9FLAO|nr:hypothetical protein EGI11_06530 [Kaistella daneshvariae]
MVLCFHQFKKIGCFISIFFNFFHRKYSGPFTWSIQKFTIEKFAAFGAFFLKIQMEKFGVNKTHFFQNVQQKNWALFEHFFLN